MTAEGYWLGRPTQILRGEDSATLQVFDPTLEIWLTFGNADIEEDAMAQGIPLLRGPYVVDYTDIPHDGDTKTLWTPAVGDVLLRLFADWQRGTGWDHGSLFIGQNVDGTLTPAHNAIVATAALGVPLVNLSSLDNIETGVGQAATTDATGTSMFNSAYVFHSADPVHIQLAQTSGDDPTAGHVEIYTLVARAVAP